MGGDNRRDAQSLGAAQSSGRSQNYFGWKRPLRSSSSSINLTLPTPPLNHVPKCHIYTSFKYLQGWGLNHFPWQPVPMLDNPFCEEIFPHIQSKPLLVVLEAISSRLTACHLGEESDIHLATICFQVVVESDKVSPPSLLFSRPNNPSSLGRTLSDFFSRPFTSLIAFLQTCSSTSMSFL